MKISKQTFATCVKWLFSHETHCVYCHCLADTFFLAVLSIFGGSAWSARWCWKASHSEAWMYLGLTFVSPYCWRERENLFFHMFMLFFFCLQFCPDGLMNIVYFGVLSQMFGKLMDKCSTKIHKSFVYYSFYDIYLGKIKILLGIFFQVNNAYLNIYSYNL